MKRILAGLLLLTAACATSGPRTPADSFATLESRLMRARGLNFDFDIASHGIVQVHMNGTLDARGSDLRILFDGEAGGEKSHGVLESDSSTLKRAVVLGLTRMGLLHNLVRILGRQSVEHAGGGMDEWVRVTNVAYDPVERKYSFDIAIEGKPTGAGGLWLAADGRPLRRQQTVHSPAGDVFVEERYVWR